MWCLLSVAFAAPAPAPEAPAPEAPAPEIDPLDELRGALDTARREAEAAATDAAAARQVADALERLLSAGEVLLDDRRPTEERVAAAEALGRTGAAGASWLLRAAVVDRDPEVREAAARAALAIPGAEGPEAVRRLMLDPAAPRELALAMVDALGAHGSRAAAQVLYGVGGQRSVPAVVRARAIRTLRERYPGQLAGLGPMPAVVDPMGGVAFVAANGLAAGMVLSSVGVFGSFGGAEAIGAVGGGAIGIGTGTLYAASDPLTLGEGLAYASGVAWGTTYGLWTTTAVHGAWRWMDGDAGARAAKPAAVWRALGTSAGAGLGGFALSRGPRTWDVLEVDAAAYLGSAVSLGAVALAAYRPPGESPTRPTYVTTYTRAGTSRVDPYRAYRLSASRWLAASEIAGATVGLASGLSLAPRWDLDWNDAAFAITVGGEAAWIGTFLPTALGVDDADLKGTIRLPWNGAVAAGLALSELRPVSFGRTAVTGWGAVTGNAIGAGIPLLAGAEARTTTGVMVPVGLAGTVGAYLAEPLLAPEGGDWAMIAVGTAVGSVEGLLLAVALDDLGARQSGGLTSLVGGITGAGLLALSPVAAPRVDEVVLIGTGSAWGGTWGALLPVALRLDPSTSGVALSSAVGGAVGTAGTGLLLALTDLEPRSTVVPQLAGLSGGTVGALIASASEAGEDVALGAVIGSAVGFGAGGAVEVLRPRRGGVAMRPSLRLPGEWTPLVSRFVGASGDAVPVFGLSATGW